MKVDYVSDVCVCVHLCVCTLPLGADGEDSGASQHCPGQEGRSRQRLIQTHLAHTCTHMHKLVWSLWMVAMTMT